VSASGFQTFRSADVDEAVEISSRLLSYDHRVTPARADVPFAWEVSGFRIGSVRLARLSYGGKVDVEMRSHSDAYGISAPSVGLLNVRTGRREVTATPEFAAVAGPDAQSAITGFEMPHDRLTMVRIELTAEASLAAIRARSRLGMAIAAMIKMIATTISNSINEKPSGLRIVFLAGKKSQGASDGPDAPWISNLHKRHHS